MTIRPVTMRYGQEAWRTALLADAAGARSPGGDALMEFIVRADDGGTLSIVQANDTGFRTGDRVVILRDGATHLGRPG